MIGLFSTTTFVVAIVTAMYVISPVDIIPETVFGVLGFVDDISVATFQICTTLTTQHHLESQHRLLVVIGGYWQSQDDVFFVCRRFRNSASKQDLLGNIAIELHSSYLSTYNLKVATSFQVDCLEPYPLNALGS